MALALGLLFGVGLVWVAGGGGCEGHACAVRVWGGLLEGGTSISVSWWFRAGAPVWVLVRVAQLAGTLLGPEDADAGSLRGAGVRHARLPALRVVITSVLSSGAPSGAGPFGVWVVGCWWWRLPGGWGVV